VDLMTAERRSRVVVEKLRFGSRWDWELSWQLRVESAPLAAHHRVQADCDVLYYGYARQGGVD